MGTSALVNTESGNSLYYDEATFWSRSIAAWLRVTARVVNDAEEADGAPVVVALIAETAGKLSLQNERLDVLHRELEKYLASLATQAGRYAVARNENLHHRFHGKVMDEAVQFRELLSIMFRLEQQAYRPFLT